MLALKHPNMAFLALVSYIPHGQLAVQGPCVLFFFLNFYIFVLINFFISSTVPVTTVVS